MPREFRESSERIEWVGAGGAMWFAVAIIASLFISEPCLHAAKPKGVKPQPRNLFIDTTHTRARVWWRTHSKHMYTFKHISQNSVGGRRRLAKNATMAHSWVCVYFINYLKHLQVSPTFLLLLFSLK